MLSSRSTGTSRASPTCRDDPTVELVECDLEVGEPIPVAPGSCAAVVVTNYLWRPILDDLVALLAPGGWLLYETFAVGNERFGRPSNPDFLLRPGELLDLASPARPPRGRPTRTSWSTSPARRACSGSRLRVRLPQRDRVPRRLADAVGVERDRNLLERLIRASRRGSSSVPLAEAGSTSTSWRSDRLRHHLPAASGTARAACRRASTGTPNGLVGGVPVVEVAVSTAMFCTLLPPVGIGGASERRPLEPRPGAVGELEPDPGAAAHHRVHRHRGMHRAEVAWHQRAAEGHDVAGEPVGVGAELVERERVLVVAAEEQRERDDRAEHRFRRAVPCRRSPPCTRRERRPIEEGHAQR